MLCNYAIHVSSCVKAGSVTSFLDSLTPPQLYGILAEILALTLQPFPSSELAGQDQTANVLK